MCFGVGIGCCGDPYQKLREIFRMCLHRANASRVSQYTVACDISTRFPVMKCSALASWVGMTCASMIVELTWWHGGIRDRYLVDFQPIFCCFFGGNIRSFRSHHMLCACAYFLFVFRTDMVAGGSTPLHQCEPKRWRWVKPTLYLLLIHLFNSWRINCSTHYFGA